MVENLTQIKHRVCKEDYIGNPATGSCKNDKYLASYIDDSVIMILACVCN